MAERIADEVKKKLDEQSIKKTIRKSEKNITPNKILGFTIAIWANAQKQK